MEKEDEEAAGMHFEEGMRLMKAGQLGKAVAAFDLALSRVPMRSGSTQSHGTVERQTHDVLPV